MKIGGLEKLSLIDFPGEVAAVVFIQECNFRCRFCYNPMLVVPSIARTKDRSPIMEDDLFDFLKKRFGKLEGVVITGGEPTLHAELPEFIKKIKNMGYKIKLDTNGTNPKMLERLIRRSAPLKKGGEGGLVDYIAMDIKSPFDKYDSSTGVNVNLEDVRKSVKIIMESGLFYEFRTTLVPALHSKEDIAKMGEMIRGAEKWFLQKFKSDTELVDDSFEGGASFSDQEMKEMADVGKKYVEICEIRG